MDELLREFLTETTESLDVADTELVKFESEPNNLQILNNIFRLVHTIKGTCGFLGLPRLEALAHAGETLMGKFRDGMPVTAEAVTLILSSIDRIKEILAGLEATENEPEGSDEDLIVKLLLNMLVIAQQTILRGGTLVVDPVGDGETMSFRVTAAGLNARVPQNIAAVLSSPTTPPAADAHGVQPYYTRLLAQACGLKVSLTPEGENVVIAAA